MACEELKARMKKVKDTMPAATTWLELVKECDSKAIDLSARHMGHPDNDGIQGSSEADHVVTTNVSTSRVPYIAGYIVWGAVATEVEVDVLTGEMNIRRTDLVEDTGSAISPEIDVGQVRYCTSMESKKRTRHKLRCPRPRPETWYFEASYVLYCQCAHWYCLQLQASDKDCRD